MYVLNVVKLELKLSKKKKNKGLAYMWCTCVSVNRGIPERSATTSKSASPAAKD